MSHLIEFYGTECPHCERMNELVLKLEKEEGVQVEKLEIWHNKENEMKMRECDKGFCGGVPFFFNTKTSKWICGEATYEELKNWAKDK
jgi:thiol-disulfide isomerase/thioredoxin